MIRPYHLTSNLLSLAMSFKQAFRLKIAKRDLIGYLSLCFKAMRRCETIAMKMEFYSPAHKTHFHKNGFAFSLIFESERFWNSGKREALVFCGSEPRDLYMTLAIFKGKLALGLAKGTIKRATKTCNLLCNVAVKRVEWRYCTFTTHVQTCFATNQVSGAPNVNFRKISVRKAIMLEIWNFQNICCKISCLPASPRIFERLKNGIIAHI